MVEILNMTSIVFFALGVLFLVWALVYFFNNNIYNIINNLSGRSARKEIEKMHGGRIDKKKRNKSKLKTTSKQKKEKSIEVNVTEILQGSNITQNNETEILESNGMPTEILSDSGAPTEIL